MLRSLFLIALVSAASSVAGAQSLSAAQLQTLYTDFLDGRGLEGFVDGDGDVQFDYDGRTYFIGATSGDDTFFNVVLMNVWPIASASERGAALEAVNAVSRDLKVVKGYVTGSDDVWLTCELFVETPSDFAPVWDRCMSALGSAVDTFADAM
jgi:hypothetical protein